MEDLGYNIVWENYCKIIEAELSQFSTVIVNMDVLKGTNCYFVLNKFKNYQTDFPQECFESDIEEVFDKSFSSEFAEGYQLQFYVNDNLIHECNSIKDFNFADVIHVVNKDYRIKASSTPNSLCLTFIQIKKEKSSHYGCPEKNKKAY